MSHVTIPVNNHRSDDISLYGGCTDVGKVRDHNEDSMLIAPPLFAVADGMGGHEAGEVASNIAINILAEQAPTDLDAEALSHAVETANYAILQAAQEGRGGIGMGTTLTAAMVDGERLLLAQVGDSRAYLLHRGDLQQLTRDHSLVADMIEAGQITPEEAKYHPQRSVITRALGSSPDTFPDIYELNVAAGDRLLLCSDGLSGMVEDNDIAEILTRVRDPQRCASQLVKQALRNGGNDNVTVIVADIKGNTVEHERKTRRKSRAGAIAIAILLLAAIVGAGFGLRYMVTNSVYLQAKDGYVAIYQGIPDSFLGFSYSELVEVTDVPVSSLNAGLEEKLTEGAVKADNLEEAQNLVEEYRETAERNEDNAAAQTEGETSTSSTTSAS